MTRVDFDREIAEAENRILTRRRLLLCRTRTVEAALRAKLTAPGILLSAAGLGYVLGRLTMPQGAGESAFQRLWATLTQAAGAAFSVLHSAPMLWLASAVGAKRSPPAVQETYY
jgi:hypothetical protein